VSKPDPTAADVVRLREASEWVQRLSESHEGAQGVTDQWMQWCSSDPLNSPAFEKMQRVWDAFAAVKDVTNREPGPATHLKRRTGLIALAAGVVLAVGFAAWLLPEYFDAQEFATPVGRQRSITLADGTHLDLAPDTLVSTHFTPTRREVDLERGQAFFAVSHNPMRPFVVHLSSLTVTDVGTAFDARIGPSTAVITVSEGQVGVTPNRDAPDSGGSSQGETVRAGVGQRVTFSKSANRLNVATVDPRLAESWRDGKLQFVGEPLEDVAAVVNRYGAAHITVAPALQQVRFTGTVLPKNVDEWLKALEQIYAVKVDDQDDQGVRGVLVRVRGDRGAQN
jgi:transmembrane sensor